MKVKSEREVVQLCQTLRDPMDCSPPGSSAHGIFQARVLEWGAIALSMAGFRRALNLQVSTVAYHDLHLRVEKQLEDCFLWVPTVKTASSQECWAVTVTVSVY